MNARTVEASRHARASVRALGPAATAEVRCFGRF